MGEYQQTIESRTTASSVMAVLTHAPSGVSVRRPASRLRMAHPRGSALVWEGLRAELDKALALGGNVGAVD